MNEYQNIVMSVPQGAIPSKFTINAQGKQVYFSRGNLCYETSFMFANNQYKAGREEFRKHYSRFFWAKDKNNSLTNDVDHYNGTEQDIFFANLDATTAHPNFIVNDQAGKWRALSGGPDGEWNYLLNKRTMKFGKQRYSIGHFCEILESGFFSHYGLFIYPDDYDGVAVGEKGLRTRADIDAKGIVFLPADGDCYHSEVRLCGGSGFYWSSNAYSSKNAYLLCFECLIPKGIYLFKGIAANSSTPRNLCRLSVRLVTDCH